MFEKKCIDEVKKFNLLKINKSLSANKLIGVREINEYLRGSVTLDKCQELINIKTRQYAKRQATWRRGHMLDWKQLKPMGLKKFLKKI